MIAVLLVATGMGAASFVTWRARSAAVPSAVSGVPITSAIASDRAAPRTPAETGSWSATGSGVIPAQVNADGTEDFLIRFQRSGDERPLFLVAIDGASFQRIWTAGPFGNDSDATAYSRVAATEKHVVVTDAVARVHVLELATGRELAQVPMSDRADRVCTSPDGAQAWIEVTDRKHLTIELATGEATAERRAPKWCAKEPATQWMIGCIHYGSEAHRNGHSRARCTDPPGKWRIDGFGRAYALRTGNGHVAVGTKNPGTAFPILVGVDPRGKVRWRRGLADDAPGEADALDKDTPKLVDVVGGLIVVAFRLRSEQWRLTALDEPTGATRWQRDLAEKSHWGAGMTVSDRRIYVLISSSIAVHDLATGNQLAALQSR